MSAEPVPYGRNGRVDWASLLYRQSMKRAKTLDGQRMFQCGRCRLFFGASEFPANPALFEGVGMYCTPCWENPPQ